MLTRWPLTSKRFVAVVITIWTAGREANVNAISVKSIDLWPLDKEEMYREDNVWLAWVGEEAHE